LNRKSIVVSRIIHIGKESNDLEKVQTFGLDSSSYVVYEDQNDLERKFREFSSLILKLAPKDVKKLGISRQTLWNVKRKIILNLLDDIANETKIKLLAATYHY
jgi:ACT domain-containing protein